MGHNKCHTKFKTRKVIFFITLGSEFALTLKEFPVLKQLILRSVRVWSIFCSIRVYTSIYYLPILFQNWLFVFPRFLCFLCYFKFDAPFTQWIEKQSIQLIGNFCFNKNVHEQVSIFNNTMNIFSNCIPNRFVTTDDKDRPRITERIKNKILEKNYIYNSYISNGKTAID